MKRMLSAALLLLALCLTTAAQDASAPVFRLAEYVPAEVSLYAGVRIDDTTIATIDGLIAKIAAVVAELELPIETVPTVRELLVVGTMTPADVDAFLAGAGETLAIGITPAEVGKPNLSLVVVSVDDRAALETFLTGIDMTAGATAGRFAVYTNDVQTALLSDEVLIVANDATSADVTMLANGDYPRLSNEATFLANIAELPADDYIAGFYGTPADQGAGITPLERMAVGVTLLDGDTLMLDVALKSEIIAQYSLPSVVIDPTFGRFIPADSALMVQSAGLGTSIELLIDMMPTLAESKLTAREQIAALLGGFSLDLDELIAWTRGDFAIFGRIDVDGVLGLAQQTTGTAVDLSALFDLGVLIETDNPAASAKVVSALTRLIKASAANTEGLTLTEETIGGTTASVITIEQSAGSGTMSLKVALASNDEIFAIGTYTAVTAALTQTAGLDTHPVAQDAMRYWLTDASSVAFIEGSTLVKFVGYTLVAAFVPAVGEVYSSITLPDGTTQATPATPVPLPPVVDTETIVAQLERFSELLQHITFSTRATDAGQVLRFTVTLGE